ncbi:lipocalin-like domain-containing protein [Roseateles sp. BYS180W]|uniref:Lipocalin-like domain-containing protein n=1 Tax=Roseateles rivi TaxID=3299028 RepID=A0ABW7FTB9_9BURK
MKTNALAPRLPVFAAPMFLVSGPELVLAACRAGIVGAFPTPNTRTPEQLEDWMRQITQGLAQLRDEQPADTLGAWCANLVTHRSNARLPEDLKLVQKYRPPVVVTALGSPKPAVEVVHSYGGLVFADVTSPTLARKAVEAGVDGLACICSGAGGHTGSISPFAFVSAVREFFDGTIVLGGGISDGWGLAGALACGADYVYMGTRFVATRESMAQQAYKQMLVDSTLEDLVVSAAITGTPASWLRPSLLANGIDPDDVSSPAPTRNYNSLENPAKRWAQLWAAGQGVGAIHAVEPVGAVVDRIEQEFHAARTHLSRCTPGAGPVNPDDNPLLGSWTLLAWEIDYGDGRPPVHPFGEGATGLIVYSSDGYMSAAISRADRAPLEGASVRQAPVAQRLGAFESHFHYAGRYRLEGAGASLRVVHEVQQALNPNFVGSQQQRHVHISADGVLTLSASEAVPGQASPRQHRLRWRRATA